MTNQELLAHTRRNLDMTKRALKSALEIREIDGANVNVHFDIERYARQGTALEEAEAALSKAV